MDPADIFDVLIQLAGKSGPGNINQILLCLFLSIGVLDFRLALFNFNCFGINDIRVICTEQVLNGLVDSFSVGFLGKSSSFVLTYLPVQPCQTVRQGNIKVFVLSAKGYCCQQVFQ